MVPKFPSMFYSKKEWSPLRGVVVLGCQDWYGAKTLGVDFQPAATAFAEKHVTSQEICWAKESK